MKSKRTLTMFGALALAVTLGACSSNGGTPSDAESDTPGTGETTSLTVGMIPTSSFVGVFVAQDMGFFADAGLDVTVNVVSNAASIVPSVLNGQMQFGTVATPPFLMAVDKGLPITGVVPTTAIWKEEGKDTGCIMVSSDNSITELEDLVGKKVATNQVGSSPHVAAVALLANAGVDPDALNYVPMPFPDMLGALEQGRVDALLTVEPFRTIGLESGKATCMSPLYTAAYQVEPTDTLILTSDDYIATSPDIVEGFVNAMAQANQAIIDDPQIARDAMVKHSNLAEEVAAAMNLPMFVTSFNVSGTQEMADQALKDGFLGQKVEVGSVLRTN